jgi:hypothetical protein
VCVCSGEKLSYIPCVRHDEQIIPPWNLECARSPCKRHSLVGCAFRRQNRPSVAVNLTLVPFGAFKLRKSRSFRNHSWKPLQTPEFHGALFSFENRRRYYLELHNRCHLCVLFARTRLLSRAQGFASRSGMAPVALKA